MDKINFMFSVTPILQKCQWNSEFERHILETNCSYLSSLSERDINNNEKPEEIGPASKTLRKTSSHHKERLMSL